MPVKLFIKRKFIYRIQLVNRSGGYTALSISMTPVIDNALMAQLMS